MNPQLISVFDALWHQILFHLRVDRISTWSEKLANIPELDLHVLALVAETPEMLLGEISRRLKIPNTTLSSAVSRMEKKNLVQRAIAPQDLRSFRLLITLQGEKALNEFSNVHSILSSRLLNCLDSFDEREELIRFFRTGALALDPDASITAGREASQADRFNEVWQKMLFGIRIDRLESWSEVFQGINQLDLHVLNHIKGNPGITLKDIRQSLQIPASTVTVMVKKLERRGCLERIVNPDDRRSWGLQIASAGIAILQEQAILNWRLWKEVLTSFNSAADQEKLLQILVKLLNRIM